jgi:hypothetical protein
MPAIILPRNTGPGAPSSEMLSGAPKPGQVVEI